MSGCQQSRGKLRVIYPLTKRHMKTNYEHLEEVNTLFEVIKTMLITGL